MTKSIGTFLLLLLLVNFPAICQNDVPFLERIITISLTNERLDGALKKIGNEAGFTFSYNPSIVETSKIVNYNFRQKTVREILDVMFNGTLEYKVRSNHLILIRAPESEKKNDEKVLSGYVVDEATGERLRNVTVYDPVTLTSALTDSYGYFEIKIDDAANAVRLSVNKQNYADTLVSVPQNQNRLLNIPIHIDKQKWRTRADSVGQRIKRFWNTKIINWNKPNLVNIRDTIFRRAQFSIIPFVGTNHLLSANVVNDYSFNLFGGYSQGVKKMEIGGLFNIDEEDSKGFQAAGIFNIVGGKFTGAQFAGTFNANYDSTKGAQFAGIANVDWNSSSKFSAAGMINFTRHQSSGGHLAGIGNFTIGDQRGGHIAGIFNFASGQAHGVQAGGVLNFTARNFKGAQLGGVLNFTGGNVRGSQVASVLNFAGKKVSGMQISGIMNYATKVKGGQIGLFNFADSVRGVSLGLFSFVLHGYHKIEFSADEIFYTNASFRTGVRTFYNIFNVGAKPETFADDQTYWTFGYGFGTAPKLTRWLYLNLDLTTNQIMTERDINAINMLNKFYLGFDLQAAKHLSFTFGATLNSYLTDNNYENYQPLFTDYQPHLITDRNYSNDINMKMWIGGKIGIRFL